MKLQQLRFLVAVAKSGLNISAAAEILYTSQPGISKQIKMLEDELGVQIFMRAGKQLTHVTPVGRKILEISENILQDVKNMKSIALEYKDEQRGSLNIATTHTQARYALPSIIQQFRAHYPEVSLHIHQGSPSQIAEFVAAGEVDLAISTESPDLFSDLISLPCYEWNRCALVPADHPLVTLAKARTITLQDLIAYPLVTYTFAWNITSPIYQAFTQAQLNPKIAFSATDADVIKAYVRMGFGVGILAQMAYVPEEDTDLVAIPLAHLFQWSTTYISLRQHVVLRNYMYAFINIFAAHLDRDTVEKAEQSTSAKQCQTLFEQITLPQRYT